MMNNIEKYLKDVCSFVKNKEVHEEISCEIREHIYDIVEEYLEEGFEEDEAIKKAILRMGSAEDSGVKLNKIHKAEPDYISLTLTGIISIITLITMFSLAKNNIASTSMVTSILGLIVGSILATGLYFFDYRKIKKYSYHIYGISSLVLLLNSVHLLKVGLITYTSDTMFIILIILILLIAISGIMDSKKIDTVTKFMKITISMIVPNIFIIFGYSNYKIYSIYLCIVYLCGLNIVLFTSNIKKTFKIILSLSEVFFLAMISLLLKKVTYILSLFSLIINPSIDPNGTGYLAMSVRNMLGNSTLFGTGFNSEIAMSVPLINRDLTLAYIIYRFGIIFGVISILVLVAFIIRLFKLKGMVKDTFGKSIILLVGTVLLVQVVFSILGNLGIISASFTLPFITSGIMNFIINISLVGLISSVYRRNLQLYN